ncbi:DUF1318 domain-containing protein, partial [Leptospira interrogans serovar Pomona]|nr:DUF1318 domain-containing protein [Leptospira interrogans serovar Pomona]
SRIDSLVTLINEHRGKVTAFRSELGSKTDTKEKSEHLKIHLEQTWYRLVEKGEYYEKSPGKWVRKE